MSIDILEAPLVAHIVADLDEIEAEEATLATFRAVWAPRTVAKRRPSRLSSPLAWVRQLHGTLRSAS